jgi:hypothetical protein
MGGVGSIEGVSVLLFQTPRLPQLRQIVYLILDGDAVQINLGKMDGAGDLASVIGTVTVNV